MCASHTVEVCTYNSRDPLALRLPDRCTIQKARAEICKAVGLQPNSMDLFGVFLGPLDEPTRILVEGDVIPTGAKISLQRWNFDVEKEMKTARRDDVAISLLYNEAVHYLDKGKIQPSDEQREELESYSDPTFPTERQFLETVSTVPGYAAFLAEGCRVIDDISTNDVHITSGTTVHCLLDMHRLAFKTDVRKSESLIEWPWTSVRRWKIPQSNEIRFEVCLMKGNAPMMNWVMLSSPMAQVIFNTAGGICNQVKQLQDKAEVPFAPPNSHMAGKHYDPLAEFVDNFLFKGPKFSSMT